MEPREPILDEPLLVYLKPEVVNYRLSAEKALEELNSRINLVTGRNKQEKNLKPVKRALYGMQLIGTPGHHILKLAQIRPTGVYRSYLSAKITEKSRIYVEPVGSGFFIFMVCDRSDRNFGDIVNLIG